MVDFVKETYASATAKLFEWEISLFENGQKANAGVVSVLTKVHLDKILYYGIFPVTVLIGAYVGQPKVQSWTHLITGAPPPDGMH